MKIISNQYNSINQFDRTKRTQRINLSSRVSTCPVDCFEKSKNDSKVSFQGKSYYTKWVEGYLKNKTYKISANYSRKFVMGMDEEMSKIAKPVQINVGHEYINAWDINPKNSDKYLIFLHGFSQNLTNNQPLYKELAKTDYGVLAIDYRGYGKNPKSRHLKEEHLVEDVDASVKYLKDKNIKNIGLVGHSFGGYIATKTSKQKQYDFQILVSPMISLDFWLKKIIKNPKRFKKENFMLRYLPEFGKSYKNVFKLEPNLEGNETPTHIIASKRDRYVRIGRVKGLKPMVSDLRSFTIVEEGGHRMDEPKINAIVDVLKKVDS